MNHDHEGVQRLRRIETRLTQLMIHMGIDTLHQKPSFERVDQGDERFVNRLRLPSPHTSIKELMSAIPSGTTGPIELFIGRDRFGTIDVDQQ